MPTAAGVNETVVIFDRYNDEPTAKDHERRKQGGIGAIDYKLSVNTPLPCREAVMKSTSTKTKLSRLLGTFYLTSNNILFVNHTDCILKHEEADITLISYMLQAAEAGALTIRILSDDTDVFVLLVYWAWKAIVQSTVQMEKWNGTSLDINATIRGLGDRCQGLLGMHALSGCDTASYPCGKGKTSALKVLLGKNICGLNTVLGEPDATHSDLKDTGTEFFIALYGQKKAKSMNNTRY